MGSDVVILRTPDPDDVDGYEVRINKWALWVVESMGNFPPVYKAVNTETGEEKGFTSLEEAVWNLKSMH